ncbi:fungal specific transcription factor [Colletotrichum simmondsii]|uniref:Fungal specific transcription factor n=1 Tax=Colletotrichum simmondsii TaxID=703756 RepID=A0A135SN09_9PEZI|nr:fungal specific transcription factor [Colletotrichum simmondsii]
MDPHANFSKRKRYIAMLREIVGEQLQEAFIRTDRVNQLSLSCLIQRAIPPEVGEIGAFGGACIASARQALEEHQRCMTLVVGLEEYYLEAYINWALLSSPFIPFIVLFCHVIETCSGSDLHLLAALVDTFRSTVAESFTIGVKKEMRMFTTLYDVACSYVNLRSGDAPAQLAAVDVKNGCEFTAENINPPVVQPQIYLTPQGVTSDPQAPEDLSNQSNKRSFGDALNDHGPTNQGWVSGSLPEAENYPMEVDDYSSQLGNWLYMNNQMIRALENNYFG